MLLACVLTPQAGAEPVPRVAEVSAVGWVTGAESPNRTDLRFRVHGTDLGIMWTDGRGGVLMAFGDTFGPGGSGHGARGDLDWRANALGRTTLGPPSVGLVIADMVQDSPGRAGEVIPRDTAVQEYTVNPTAGISVRGRQYLHYMSVRSWGAPGHWRTNYAGIAYSDDGGARWTKAATPRWDNSDGGNGFQLAALVRDDRYVYLFGKPNGRFGSASLARVRDDEVLDKAAYEYWDGLAWRPDEARARPVFGDAVGELSVGYRKYCRCWMAMYLDERRAAIVLRTSPTPIGPWSPAREVVSSRDYPGLYAPFIHPEMGSRGEVYFVMSQWEQYNVRLMRMRLG
ncbi:carbohydrate-binding protein [Saccharopolyspora erythraea NRRL 2338]|uniref:Carbohydrate-binding protein n=1 Tax=Saccharopolyspora erythraea (strain ATCC 11635 / DSM 40517 / JCM 4748 / NBRC 13426 / NCIMB 8594 / NRRL 2338) TaxID=405948 RepID=A4FIM0_SACEN|nr:carbohydrate-binding protein [Saccharopolyspora erythraea NRRL 2338]